MATTNEDFIVPDKSIIRHLGYTVGEQQDTLDALTKMIENADEVDSYFYRDIIRLVGCYAGSSKTDFI